ncbi:hypothetical protein ACWLMY_36630 [Streptomyces anulatus]
MIARRSGRTTTVVEDISLLHHQLRLGIDQIASLTGTEAAAVAALLAAADREAGDRTGRVRLWASMIKPVTSAEARWRHAFRLRTAGRGRAGRVSSESRWTSSRSWKYWLIGRNGAVQGRR